MFVVAELALVLFLLTTNHFDKAHVVIETRVEGGLVDVTEADELLVVVLHRMVPLLT